MTTIAWVGRPDTKAETWNPFVGCSLVSPGCTNCYAMHVAGWIDGMGKTDRYSGTVKEVNGRPVWTGLVKRSAPKIFDAPLRWTKPRTVFANSMSDLFHGTISLDDLWDAIAVMAATPQHTYQVLTKRADRMRFVLAIDGGQAVQRMHDALFRIGFVGDVMLTWPLPNVWWGISAEDQQRLVERWPDLRDTPATVRFISAEPLLGPLNLAAAGAVPQTHHHPDNRIANGSNESRKAIGEIVRAALRQMGDRAVYADWVIVGGESGPRARPFDLQWARSIRNQCQTTGTSVFIKQMGAVPCDGGKAITLADKKGETVSEWPDDLRVQEWPA